jgi:hypothetical protein
MSYLSKIAARAIEQPQPIRPRLASLFEPAAGPRVRSFEPAESGRSVTVSRTATRAEMESETIPAPHRQPRVQTREGTEAIQQPAILPENEPHPANAVADPAARIAVRAQATDIPNVSAHTVERSPSPAVQPAERLPSDPTALEQEQPARERIRPATATTAHPRVIEPLVIEKEPESSPSALRARETPAIQPKAPQGPTVKVTAAAITAPAPIAANELPEPESLAPIQVTIGRVEVRAIMAAPTPPPVARRSEPEHRALSLDDYLQQRKGASR